MKQVCKQKSHSVAALLHSARPILVEPGTDTPILVLQAAYQFHLEKLREPAGKAAVEWALYQVLSQHLRVRLTLRNDSEGGRQAAAGSEPEPQRAPALPGQVRWRSRTSRAATLPLTTLSPCVVHPRPTRPRPRLRSGIAYRPGAPRGRGTGRSSHQELTPGGGHRAGQCAPPGR